jgi:hypothetical protein
VTTPDERLEALRALALAADVEVISDPEELARQGIRAHVEDIGGFLPPDLPEVDVRLHGPGVPAHDIPVREATAILTSLQETVASIGQALSQHKTTSSGPINAQILKSTELRMSPTVLPGSVVFHLTGPGEDITGEEALALTGTETLVDAAMRELFALVEQSQKTAELETAGLLAHDLRRFGPRVAKHLSDLTGNVISDEIDLDLSWRTPRGQRQWASLQRHSAQTLQDAIKLNEVKSSRVELTGVLTTISLTHKAELRMLDNRRVQISANDKLAASLGPFFNERVTVVAEETVRWSINTGRETRTYRMLDIRHAEPNTDSSSHSEPGSQTQPGS